MNLNNRLEGKVVVVTGGATGIGKACVERYIEEGAKVVFANRSSEKGRKLEADLRAKGKPALFVQTDATKDEDLDNLIKSAIDEFGKIDVVHCNAGNAIVGMIEDFTVEDWDRTYALDVRHIFVLAKKALPFLKETKGNILVTASCAAFNPRPLSGAYASSKAAAIVLCKVMAREFAPYSIRVNALCPGLTETDILAGTPDDALAGILRDIPLGKLGLPADQAAAAAFLISDDASFITGQTLVVDGGQTA